MQRTRFGTHRPTLQMFKNGAQGDYGERERKGGECAMARL